MQMRLVVATPLLALSITACRAVPFGDPGVTFAITNRCGTDIEIDVRLATDAPEDFSRLVPNEVIRFAQADAPLTDFELRVRAVGDPASTTVTTPARPAVSVEGDLCPG